MNRWTFLFILLALVSPAQADDVAFPIGSRIGLAPPPGMSPSRNFSGFEDAAHSVAVVIAALPREAHWDLRRSTSAEELKKRGITFEKREEQKLDAGEASLVIARVTVQVPDEAANVYPETAIRTALSTVTIRATVPIEEHLGLLPFRVGELAQFRIGGVLPGRAIML